MAKRPHAKGAAEASTGASTPSGQADVSQRATVTQETAPANVLVDGSKPELTVLRDEKSRTVVGYHVSYDPQAKPDH
jgi:hypothetical protein